MSRPPAKALLFLTGRWLRSPAARRSSVILVVSFAVLALVFVCVSAFTLSADQEADKDFGAYQQMTSSSVYVGDLNPGFLRRAGLVLSSVVSGSHLLIETDQLRPDSFVKTYVQAPLTLPRFVEDPGLREAFPGRYSLDQGSWPGSPFDVLVSRHLLDALPDRTRFTVLSGRVTLHVVGVVTDAYAKHDDLIVAGPDTWESIPRPAAGHAYQPVEAEVMVFFGSSASLTDVARVMVGVLPPLPKAAGNLSDYLKSNYSTRSQVEAVPVATFGSGQLVVSYLPLLLVVLMVSALVVGQTRGGHRANADRLVAIGLRRGQVVLTQVLTLAVVAAGSIAAGLGLGWLLALGLRGSVLPHYADQPLSPVPGLDRTSVAIAASSLLLITAGALWPAQSTVAARWLVVSRYLAGVRIGLLRRVSIVLLIVVALRVGGSITSVVTSYLVVAAVLLAAPDLLRAVVSTLPKRNPRTFVIGRLMRADLARQAAAVAVVGCCLALPICAGTQLASKKASDASYTYSRIPAHQIWIRSDNGIGDLPGVARAVSKVQDVGRPVVLRELTTPGSRGQISSEAFFLRAPTSGNSNSTVMVIDSADQARQIIGDQLPANAETVLNRGGVLDFTSAIGDQKLVVYSGNGNRQLVTPVLPTLKVSLDQQLSANFGGAVLLSTARKLNLPISDPRIYIYPDATPQVIGKAVHAAVNAGYDSEFVQYFVPPPPPELPTNAYVYLAGLVLGGFTVLLLVIRAQARRLRTYSSRLVAIGLGPRWTRSVLLIQAAVIVGVGLLVGVSAGVLGVVITCDRYAAFSVPVLPITLACAVTIIAAGLATALAVRALTATEHPQVN
ncbi:MAG: hypothetical protein ACR2LE_03425 [Nocardioidaceae bacterium]